MNKTQFIVMIASQQGAPVVPISYAFRDLFTTDRAAGAVDGTAAEPGTNTRAVTDTGSKVSISGGLLSISGGEGGYGTPDFCMVRKHG